MINNVIIVGRLCHDPVLNTIDEGITVCNLTLAVTRPFKDMNTGEYGTDFINVSLWFGISKIAYDYTSKGDIIGIKGRLTSKTKEINGTKRANDMIDSCVLGFFKIIFAINGERVTTKIINITLVIKAIADDVIIIFAVLSGLAAIFVAIVVGKLNCIMLIKKT